VKPQYNAAAPRPPEREDSPRYRISSSRTPRLRGEHRAALGLTVLPTLAAAALIALFCALGVWQLHRADEKRALRIEFDHRLQEAPVTIGAWASDATGLRNRRAMAAGAYDTGHQFLLDNRTHEGRPGYQVLTPLRLANAGVAVLVNRGWVPLGASRQKLPAVPAPSGPVRVAGIVAVPSAHPFLLGPAGYEAGGWPRVVQAIELAPMRKVLGYDLLPYTLRLAATEPDGFVREWRPYIGFGPARHQAYAVQWFALAATVLAVYVTVTLRRRRAPERDRGP
jgi:surfeit locus 1 family protein